MAKQFDYASETHEYSIVPFIRSCYIFYTIRAADKGTGMALSYGRTGIKSLRKEKAFLEMPKDIWLEILKQNKQHLPQGEVTPFTFIRELSKKKIRGKKRKNKR